MGFEPTHLKGTDLQSAATLQLRRLPILLLIGRVHSKSYHSGRALTQVIILQLPNTTPEGVTLYLCTLFGCPSGARTQDTAVNSRMLVPTELRGNIKVFYFLTLYIITYFFWKIKKDFLLNSQTYERGWRAEWNQREKLPCNLSAYGFCDPIYASSEQLS